MGSELLEMIEAFVLAVLPGKCTVLHSILCQVCSKIVHNHHGERGRDGAGGSYKVQYPIGEPVLEVEEATRKAVRGRPISSDLGDIDGGHKITG